MKTLYVVILAVMTVTVTSRYARKDKAPASYGNMKRKIQRREPLPDAPAIARTRENDAENEISAQIKVIKGLLDDLSIKPAKRCASSAGCPSGWDNSGDFCYYVPYTTTGSSSDARETCQQLGGDLPIIKSADENTFLLELIAQRILPDNENVWIGLQRDSYYPWPFYWIDGTPLQGQYENWNDGEPNDAGGNEGCGEMFAMGSAAGKWNDVPCDRSFTPAVVCQKPAI